MNKEDRKAKEKDDKKTETGGIFGILVTIALFIASIGNTPNMLLLFFGLVIYAFLNWLMVKKTPKSKPFIRGFFMSSMIVAMFFSILTIGWVTGILES